MLLISKSDISKQLCDILNFFVGISTQLAWNLCQKGMTVVSSV